MAIAVQLDEIMEDRGVSLQKLSHCVGITNVIPVADQDRQGAIHALLDARKDMRNPGMPARRHIEVRGAVAVENELTVKGFLAKMPD